MAEENKQLLSNEVIGVGFHYPFRIDSVNGGVVVTTGLDNIVQSIVHILDVSIGELPGTRPFGSNIYDLVFTINDEANDSLLQHYILEPLDRWEPRIQIISVAIGRGNYSKGQLDVSLDFMILQTHDVTSMVYPFYLPQEER